VISEWRVAKAGTFLAGSRGRENRGQEEGRIVASAQEGENESSATSEERGEAIVS